MTVVYHTHTQYCAMYKLNTPRHYCLKGGKKKALLTGVLEADVRGFLFKDFFLSPSSIIKEPDSMSLSAALAVGNSVPADPLGKVSSATSLINQ